MIVVGADWEAPPVGCNEECWGPKEEGVIHLSAGLFVVPEHIVGVGGTNYGGGEALKN